MTKKKSTCFLGACNQSAGHRGLHDRPKRYAAKIARMKRRKGYKPPPRCRACRLRHCTGCSRLSHEVKKFKNLDAFHCPKHCKYRAEQEKLLAPVHGRMAGKDY